MCVCQYLMSRQPVPHLCWPEGSQPTLSCIIAALLTHYSVQGQGLLGGAPSSCCRACCCIAACMQPCEHVKHGIFKQPHPKAVLEL